MTTGKISYCLVDETDKNENFECEGKVLEVFLVQFQSSEKRGTFAGFKKV